MAILPLEDFLKQIAQASIEAAQACAHQQEQRLLDHLNQDGSPKTITFRLQKDGTPIEVPRIVLLPQSSMLPEELEVELSSNVLLPESESSDQGSMSLTFRQMEENSQASSMKVRIKMRRKNSPEAIELLRDKMVAQLSDDLHKTSMMSEGKENG